MRLAGAARFADALFSLPIEVVQSARRAVPRRIHPAVHNPKRERVVLMGEGVNLPLVITDSDAVAPARNVTSTARRRVPRAGFARRTSIGFSKNVHARFGQVVKREGPIILEVAVT